MMTTAPTRANTVFRQSVSNAAMTLTVRLRVPECSSAGSCEKIPGYCDEKTACPGKQKCRQNQCGNECLDDKECTAENFCDGGSCNPRPECGDNAITAACAEGKECVGGICKIKIVQCGGDPVYFDYDRSNIKRGEAAKLTSVAECLKGDNTAPVTIAGHCDERGTEEYNMALGERRAQSARKYLERLGVAGNKLNTVSYGKERPAADGSNEGAWKKNRRAEFSAR